MVDGSSANLKRIMWLVLLFTLTVFALFYDTAWSMVSIWIRSETYAHGFIILPISLWLAWEKRAELARMEIRPNFWVLGLMVPVGFVWLLSSLVDVLVVQQLTLVTLLVLGIWAIVGNIIAAALSFALGFLFLAVPMGEDLVPPMMEFTATSTVWLIQMTGIPVYREGLYFTLPTGHWSVVEACSGIRYLIASFTLGLLYAYLTYRSLPRRLLFVLASIIVPVIANTLRAYMIVMLGHMSEMKIATGVDHLIYGWVFFGIVMMLLFWIGSLWREEPVEAPVAEASLCAPQSMGSPSNSVGIRGILAATIVAAIWPLFSVAVNQSAGTSTGSDFVFLGELNPWEAVPAPVWDWTPGNPGADRELVQFYRMDEKVVAVYVQQYRQQEQGVELVTDIAQIIGLKGPWHITAQSGAEIQLREGRLPVDQTGLSGAGGKLTVWTWYRIGERYTSNRYYAKFLEALGKMTFSHRGGARIALAVNEGTVQDARQTLQSFVTLALPAIEAVLDDSAAVDILP